jgi:LysR family glycine cleavage system transcriptional activator
MRRLPFLNGIRAFEAAGRTGSFAAAAAELHVSPAAISRMVKLLEERLGLPLFERQANRLAPTTAGARYLAGLTPLLDGLAVLTEEVAALGGRQVLTLGVGPTFAIRWLIPRLADWQRRQPGVEVRITTGGAAVPFAPDWTCGIRLGEGALGEDAAGQSAWPGFAAIPLFAADLTPVCVPALARRLRAPADLAAASLLRVGHAAEDWPRWLAAAGLDGLEARGPLFEYYGQALQAAADGLGVAMGIRPYIDDDLAAGRLVAPFGLTVSKGMRWYLVHRPQRAAEPAFAAFLDWITAAAGRTRPSRAQPD